MEGLKKQIKAALYSQGGLFWRNPSKLIFRSLRIEMCVAELIPIRRWKAYNAVMRKKLDNQIYLSGENGCVCFTQDLLIIQR